MKNPGIVLAGSAASPRSSPPGLPLLAVLAGAVLLAAVPDAGRAGNWPGWRGPTGVGLSDETDLPLTWGGKKNENVLWKAVIGGRGYSSPIVWGDRVFVTTGVKKKSTDPKKKEFPQQYVVCYEAADGKELWRTLVPLGPWQKDENVAVPTPVTDGHLVYAWFGTGSLAALDQDGKIVWHEERPGPFFLNPAMSGNPILYKDTLVLLCAHNGDKNSFVQALDKKTGAVKWEQQEPRAGATNATPLLIKVKGKVQLIVPTARLIQGVDLDTGKVLWSCANKGFVPSPAYGSGLLYTDHGADGPGIAVDPTGAGDVTKTHVRWRTPKVPWGYSSPIVVGPYVYRATRPGLLKCWKLDTGEQVYSKRLDGITTVSNPFATADGRIYFASAGRTYVIKAGPQPLVLATNTLPAGDNGPSAAVSGGRIFLRSDSTLFCIGKKE